MNNPLRYLGFGTNITAPGNWLVAGAVDEQRAAPLPGEEGGGVDVRPLHCRCGPAVLPALTLFGNALVILPGRLAAVSCRPGIGHTQNPLQGDGPRVDSFKLPALARKNSYYVSLMGLGSGLSCLSTQRLDALRQRKSAAKLEVVICHVPNKA